MSSSIKETQEYVTWFLITFNYWIYIHEVTFELQAYFKRNNITKITTATNIVHIALSVLKTSCNFKIVLGIGTDIIQIKTILAREIWR